MSRERNLNWDSLSEYKNSIDYDESETSRRNRREKQLYKQYQSIATCLRLQNVASEKIVLLVSQKSVSMLY